jgi:hypothetical protein
MNDDRVDDGAPTDTRVADLRFLAEEEWNAPYLTGSEVEKLALEREVVQLRSKLATIQAWKDGIVAHAAEFSSVLPVDPHERTNYAGMRLALLALATECDKA